MVQVVGGNRTNGGVGVQAVAVSSTSSATPGRELPCMTGVPPSWTSQGNSLKLFFVVHLGVYFGYWGAARATPECPQGNVKIEANQ